MTAEVIQFPVASLLQRSVAGGMTACWEVRNGGPVDIEAIGRLRRNLQARRAGRRQVAVVLRQLQAAGSWLEAAREAAVIQATQDGESAGEDADVAANRAVDLIGALGLLAMCAVALRPEFAAMSTADIEDAWKGLQLDVG